VSFWEFLLCGASLQGSDSSQLHAWLRSGRPLSTRRYRHRRAAHPHATSRRWSPPTGPSSAHYWATVSTGSRHSACCSELAV
jgi:hypothetical protein